jgi:hypothetical protein
MKEGDPRKWFEAALFQFAITMAGCLAALYVWRNALGNLLLVN